MKGINYYKFWRRISSYAAFRARKGIFNLFMELIKPDENAAVLDVGVTGDIVNKGDNYFEKLYPWKEKITGAGVEDAYFLEKEYPGFKFVKTDAKNLPFSDNSFDIVFSSATAEHVGSRENQKKFVSEILRVGGKIFITTPNRHFPVEVHTGLPFFHFLPRTLYRKILKTIGLEFFSMEENLNLLSKKEFLSLFPKDSVRVIKKSGILVAVRK